MTENSAVAKCPECGGPLVDNPYPYCESCRKYFPLPQDEVSADAFPDSEPAKQAHGIRLLCALWLLYGLVQLGLGVLLLGAGRQDYEPVLTGFGVAQLAVGATILAAAAGLWLLRPWGWRLAILCLSISVLFGVCGLAWREVGLMTHLAAIPLLIYIVNRKALFHGPEEPPTKH